MNSIVNKKVKMPSELIDIIYYYSDKKCHVCLLKLNQLNKNNFFEFPLNNKYSKLYCSQLCYEHF